MRAAAGTGVVPLPEIEVEDGQVVSGRVGAMSDVPVRAADAVEGLEAADRGAGGGHDHGPPGGSVSAR